MHEGIPPKLFPVYDLPFKAKMCSEMKRCITKWSISKYFSFSTFPIFFCVCVCTNRNDDFFFATKQFSLLLLLTVEQYLYSPRVLISTRVLMFVRAFVCKFVVLSFVQCTLDLDFLNSFHVGVKRKISRRTLLHLWFCCFASWFSLYEPPPPPASTY